MDFSLNDVNIQDTRPDSKNQFKDIFGQMTKEEKKISLVYKFKDNHQTIQIEVIRPSVRVVFEFIHEVQVSRKNYSPT